MSSLMVAWCMVSVDDLSITQIVHWLAKSILVSAVFCSDCEVYSLCYSSTAVAGSEHANAPSHSMVVHLHGGCRAANTEHADMFPHATCRTHMYQYMTCGCCLYSGDEAS